MLADFEGLHECGAVHTCDCDVADVRVQVQTVIDTIAGLMRKNPDDVALYYQNNKLAVEKTLEECHISAQGEAIVEPITVNFVYKTEGTEDDWDEVRVVEYASIAAAGGEAPAADGDGAAPAEAPSA